MQVSFSWIFENIFFPYIDKHNIEIVFDFDDCYRELLNQFETIEIKDNTEISRIMELVGREAV